MPSTIIASSSSRILRAPRSAAIAEPPAPAISSDVAIGPASRTTASTAAEPVKDWAPNCLIRPPTCSAMTAPNGIATSAVGTIVTDAMNQACWRNSRSWKGRRNRPRKTSSPNAKSFPAVPIGASTREEVMEDISGPRGHGHVLLERARAAGSTSFSRHHSPGSRWLRRGMPLEGSSCIGIGRQRRQLLVLLGARARRRPSPRDMPIGPTIWALRNCRTTGSSEDSSISRGPNIARCLW